MGTASGTVSSMALNHDRTRVLVSVQSSAGLVKRRDSTADLVWLDLSGCNANTYATELTV